ncbi:MAG: MMPL family transporter, partial [Acetobacteraceae bacterium]|nr:MMPL family transporter [Acetobacteraceae bacterium]
MSFAGTRAGVRAWPIGLALAVALFLCTAVLGRLDVRTDMADFLPSGETEAARFMLQELRTGVATSLLLVGIEGAPVQELARLSRDFASDLERSGRFVFVSNGQEDLAGADGAFLFAHRYLLSPATNDEAFSIPALRADFKTIFHGLTSSASPLVQRFGLTDPTGAFPALLREWAGSAQPRVEGGVWFARDRDRALLLLQTRAQGMDINGQEDAEGAIEAAFRKAQPGTARLLIAGPGAFARAAADAMRSDIQVLSIVSIILVVTLLVWRFRSPLVIAAIATPVVISTALAAVIVQAAYGFVHGAALGFGMTVLGVSVDYPVLLIGHRKQGEAVAGTLRRIGKAFALAVTTAVLGLSGMMFAGFPGLAQLGLFSAGGLAVAALATRFVLAPLIVAADLAPVSAGDPARLLRIERLRQWRMAGLVPLAASVVFLVASGGPHWEQDLENLSPTPAAMRTLDNELRREIGAPDAGQVGVVEGNSPEAVLSREEALLPMIDRLQARGAIAGAEIAARYLPSEATQLARRAVLPPPDVLSARVAEAQSGLPFRPEAFGPFIEAVAEARAMPPLGVSDIKSPVMAARLQALLFPRQGAWYGLIALSGVRDPASVEAAFTGAGIIYLDMRQEANRMVRSALRRAWLWLAAGGCAALGALFLGLRNTGRVARVVGSVLSAAILTLAVLTSFGVRLSLVHIVALQFVAGVGLDYALFFARPQLDQEERARTLRTLVTCNAMALLTFGLLAFCRTPILQAIGMTVVIG